MSPLNDRPTAAPGLPLTLLGVTVLVAAVGLYDAHASAADPFRGFIADASRRFAIPQPWIRAVVQQESGGKAWIVSPKGAIGLMQVMPETYSELRHRYGLGPDPYNPRDNILAGTAYLAEMRDRFGLAGFLAAYNAGPRRYERHLATGRQLPEETITYIASVSRLAGLESFGTVRLARNMPRSANAPLFVVRQQRALAVDLTALEPQSHATFNRSRIAVPPRADSLFAARWTTRDLQ
jgi:soluble lytic murein transglycosylase-like protein